MEEKKCGLQVVFLRVWGEFCSLEERKKTSSYCQCVHHRAMGGQAGSG